MNEQKLQFRVGIFVIATSLVAAFMVFQFSELKVLWEPRYTLAIHFDEAPGVLPSTPVRQNGITIGSVSEIVLDEDHGGVLVLVDIQEQFRLRKDVSPHISLTLLGDASIDFSPGNSKQFLSPGDRLKGEPPSDPMQIVNRLDHKLTKTLDSFEATSREWQKVGRNMNNLLDTNHGNLELIIERTAVSLEQFTNTMKNANKVLGDPRNQENLQKMLAAIPTMIEDTQKTVATVSAAVESAERTLKNLDQFTAPLATRSESIAKRLDSTLGNLENLTSELNDFARVVNRKDGSMRKLASDPELYRNLNQSAASLSILLKNIDPIVRDLRIFSDKVARHPELIGVSGAFNGSSGLKNDREESISPKRSRMSKRLRPGSTR